MSEDVEEVVARLTGIAHATLDDNPHCSGFQVVQLGRETDDPDALLNQDGAAGNPAFYQVRMSGPAAASSGDACMVLSSGLLHFGRSTLAPLECPSRCVSACSASRRLALLHKYWLSGCVLLLSGPVDRLGEEDGGVDGPRAGGGHLRNQVTARPRPPCAAFPLCCLL